MYENVHTALKVLQWTELCIVQYGMSDFSICCTVHRTAVHSLELVPTHTAVQYQGSDTVLLKAGGGQIELYFTVCASNVLVMQL